MTREYLVARGFQPPPGWPPRWQRSGWLRLLVSAIAVLIASTALGWYVALRLTIE